MENILKNGTEIFYISSTFTLIIVKISHSNRIFNTPSKAVKPLRLKILLEWDIIEWDNQVAKLKRHQN